MKIALTLLTLSCSIFGAQCQQRNITYSVITSQQYTVGMAVIVDGATYPLEVNHGILYQGEAPVATTSYHYATVNTDNGVNASEPFPRTPIQEDTLNEFFNRSSNTYNVSVLPQYLPPLPVVNRIVSDLHPENQIPIINLWGNETAINNMNNNQLEDIDIELNLTYFGLEDVQVFENVKVNIAGSSSRNFDKLSYNIKIKKKKDESLFGFKNIKLRSLVGDTTYVREKVCYSVIKSLGMPASDFSYVRLFVNNQPAGLFGLIETFQDPWLSNEFSNGDTGYTSGYLYQGHFKGAADPTMQHISDLSYYENITDYGLGEYGIKVGPNKKAIEGYSALQDFTKFIHEASDTTTMSDWENYLDTQSFLRGMVAENILALSDGYMTMTNNYYLYSDPENNGRMIYIPSDLDTTLGISIYELDLMHTGNYTEFPGLTFRPLTKKFFSYEYFSTPYQNILLNITKSLYNPTVMDPYIAEVKSMIKSDVEWDLTLPRLGHPNFSALPTTLGSGGSNNIFPPGILTNFTSQGAEDVNVFIAAKSSAILKFYNQTSTL